MKICVLEKVDKFTPHNEEFQQEIYQHFKHHLSDIFYHETSNFTSQKQAFEFISATFGKYIILDELYEKEPTKYTLFRFYNNEDRCFINVCGTFPVAVYTIKNIKYYRKIVLKPNISYWLPYFPTRKGCIDYEKVFRNILNMKKIEKPKIATTNFSVIVCDKHLKYFDCQVDGSTFYANNYFMNDFILKYGNIKEFVTVYEYIVFKSPELVNNVFDVKSESNKWFITIQELLQPIEDIYKTFSINDIPNIINNCLTILVKLRELDICHCHINLTNLMFRKTDNLIVLSNFNTSSYKNEVYNILNDFPFIIPDFKFLKDGFRLDTYAMGIVIARLFSYFYKNVEIAEFTNNLKEIIESIKTDFSSDSVCISLKIRKRLISEYAEYLQLDGENELNKNFNKNYHFAKNDLLFFQVE